jgi:hypothetical protein
VVPLGLLFLVGWSFANLLKNAEDEDNNPNGPNHSRMLAMVHRHGGDRQQKFSDAALGFVGAQAGLWLSVCLAIALPYYATTLVVDRVQRCTYVATSQGLPLTAYWAGTLVNNYLQNFILCMVVPIVLVVFNAPFFSEAAQIAKILPAALLAPVPMLLFAYNASRIFANAEACAKFMPAVALGFSVIPYLAVYLLTLIGLAMQLSSLPADGGPPSGNNLDTGLTLHTWAGTLHWIFSFADPFYCLPGTFAAIGLSGLQNTLAPTAECELDPACKAHWEKTFEKIDLGFPELAGSFVLIPILGQLVLCAFLLVVLLWNGERCTSEARSRLGQAIGGSTVNESVEESAKDRDVVKEENQVDTIASQTRG